MIFLWTFSCIYRVFIFYVQVLIFGIVKAFKIGYSFGHAGYHSFYFLHFLLLEFFIIFISFLEFVVLFFQFFILFAELFVDAG